MNNILNKTTLFCRESLYIITGGDPAGIGPEIIHKSLIKKLSDFFPTTSNTQFHPTIILYLSTADKKHNLAIQKEVFKHKCTFRQLPRANAILNIGKILESNSNVSMFILCTLNENASVSTPCIQSGLLAYESLELACTIIKRYYCKALLTAPLAKEWVIKAGKKNFSGHTEFLARFFKSSVCMLMHGSTFSVIPLTCHIPLAKVPKYLIQKLKKNL